MANINTYDITCTLKATPPPIAPHAQNDHVLDAADGATTAGGTLNDCWMARSSFSCLRHWREFAEMDMMNTRAGGPTAVSRTKLYGFRWNS